MTQTPNISQKPINRKRLNNSLIAVNRTPQTSEAAKKDIRQSMMDLDFRKMKKTIIKNVINIREGMGSCFCWNLAS
jgi:hypothetical protein